MSETDDTAIQELRAAFERTSSCSYRFQRSRRGVYKNPATATKWRWFLAGYIRAQVMARKAS